MIKTEQSYKKTLKELEKQEEHIINERKRFKEIGLTDEQIQTALEPSICLIDQIKEEITFYENVKIGNFNSMIQLSEIGNYLIAYRIYKGISQSELATRLDVSEAQISRDERNEYYGSSIEKIVKVMNAIEMEVKISIVK